MGRELLSGEVLFNKEAVATYGYLNVSKIEVHLSSTSHMWLGATILDNVYRTFPLLQKGLLDTAALGPLLLLFLSTPLSAASLLTISQEFVGSGKERDVSLIFPPTSCS